MLTVAPCVHIRWPLVGDGWCSSGVCSYLCVFVSRGLVYDVSPLCRVTAAGAAATSPLFRCRQLFVLRWVGVGIPHGTSRFLMISYVVWISDACDTTVAACAFAACALFMSKRHLLCSLLRATCMGGTTSYHPSRVQPSSMSSRSTVSDGRQETLEHGRTPWWSIHRVPWLPLHHATAGQVQTSCASLSRDIASAGSASGIFPSFLVEWKIVFTLMCCCGLYSWPIRDFARCCVHAGNAGVSRDGAEAQRRQALLISCLWPIRTAARFGGVFLACGPALTGGLGGVAPSLVRSLSISCFMALAVSFWSFCVLTHGRCPILILDGCIGGC